MVLDYNVGAEVRLKKLIGGVSLSHDSNDASVEADVGKAQPRQAL